MSICLSYDLIWLVDTCNIIKTYCVSLKIKIEKNWTVYKFKSAKKQTGKQKKISKQYKQLT